MRKTGECTVVEDVVLAHAIRRSRSNQSSRPASSRRRRGRSQRRTQSRGFVASCLWPARVEAQAVGQLKVVAEGTANTSSEPVARMAEARWPSEDTAPIEAAAVLGAKNADACVLARGACVGSVLRKRAS